RDSPTNIHGEAAWTWPTLHWAQSNGHDLRLGLEDTLTGPAGEPVTSTADLFAFFSRRDA
ncbi:3-keto-5-aminohexanoate cleavage protein, partial [Kribbella antibiotica]|uniref:3-keto-5-aminohexanoate cleavage protein n=1 Tax=Kribbella antibiotica TaxID=190195 RepID=UPI001404805E